MNIIKFKDILMPKTEPMSEFFNKNLKGKYAYWVQMRYIFPLESLDYKTYINYEQFDHVHFLAPDILPHIDLYSEESCMGDFAAIYVDTVATEKANAVSKFIVSNNYVAEEDVDINNLRKFRTWLAEELLKFNKGIDGGDIGLYTPEQIHILEYYKNGMYNDVVKYLSVFGGNEPVMYSNTSECGCCSTNISSLYEMPLVGVCDALKIYSDNIHLGLIKMFEDVNFWKQFNVDFIKILKKYIDNIVKIGFTMNNTTSVIKFSDCNCSSQSDNTANERMLRNLSESLGFIIDRKIVGHLNFITDSLHNWAEHLYEYMFWPIK